MLRQPVKKTLPAGPLSNLAAVSLLTWVLMETRFSNRLWYVTLLFSTPPPFTQDLLPVITLWTDPASELWREANENSQQPHFLPSLIAHCHAGLGPLRFSAAFSSLLSVKAHRGFQTPSPPHLSARFIQMNNHAPLASVRPAVFLAIACVRVCVFVFEGG